MGFSEVCLGMLYESNYFMLRKNVEMKIFIILNSLKLWFRKELMLMSKVFYISYFI